MPDIVLLITTVASLVAVVYVHYRLPFHSATRKQAWLSRAILLVVGAAFGWVNVQIYGAALSPLAVFLSAFGIVHVPGAFILFIKRKRHAWR